MSTYADFIADKLQYSGMSGFEPVYLPEFLFDFQRTLVDWACRKGRSAIFADCGMGTTSRPGRHVLSLGYGKRSRLLGKIPGFIADPMYCLESYVVRELSALFPTVPAHAKIACIEIALEDRR